MKFIWNGIEIECTPSEFLELTKSGFNQQLITTDKTIDENDDAWQKLLEPYKPGTPDPFRPGIITAYGCGSPKQPTWTYGVNGIETNSITGDDVNAQISDETN